MYIDLLFTYFCRMISVGFEILLKYFSSLSALQQKQFADFAENLLEWNAKINLISRSDRFSERMRVSVDPGKYRGCQA